MSTLAQSEVPELQLVQPHFVVIPSGSLNTSKDSRLLFRYGAAIDTIEVSQLFK